MNSFYSLANKKEAPNNESEILLNYCSSSNAEVSQSSSFSESSKLIVKIESLGSSTEKKKSKKNVARADSQQIISTNKLLNNEKTTENSIKSISKINLVPKDLELENNDYTINIKSSKNPKLSYYNSNLKEIKKIILNSEDVRDVFNKNSVKIYYEEKKKCYNGSKSPINNKKKIDLFKGEKRGNFSKFKSNKAIIGPGGGFTFNKKTSLFTKHEDKFENELESSVEVHEEEVNIMDLITTILQKQVGTRSKDELFLIENYLKTFPSFMKILNSDNYSSDSDDLLRMITKYIKCEIVPKDTLLCRFGEVGEKFYIIFKGNASILIPKEIHTQMNIIEYENRLSLLSKMKEYELLYKTITSNRHLYMNSDILTMKLKLEMDTTLYNPDEIEQRETINPTKYILRLEPSEDFIINNNKNNNQEKTNNNINNETHKNHIENNNLAKKKQTVLINEDDIINSNNENNINHSNINNEVVSTARNDNNARPSIDKNNNNNNKSNFKEENSVHSAHLKVRKHITQANIARETINIKPQQDYESNNNIIHLISANTNNANNSFNFNNTNYNNNEKILVEDEPKIINPIIKNTTTKVTSRKTTKYNLKKNQRNTEIQIKKENLGNLNSSKLFVFKKEAKEPETNEVAPPAYRESPRKTVNKDNAAHVSGLNVESSNNKDIDLTKYKRQNVIIWSYFNVTNLMDGQTFGDVALCKDSKKRTATIITIEDTICGTLDVNLYNRCIRDAQRKIRKTILHFLLSINFLRGINEDVFESKYLNMFKLNILNRNDFLFKLGEECNCIYIIKQGEIAVCLDNTIMEINNILEKKNVDLVDSKTVEENMCKISENFKNFYEKTKNNITIKIHSVKSTIGLNDYVINQNGKRIFFADAKCISENAEVYTVDDSLLKSVFINEKCTAKGEFIFKNMEKNVLLRIIDIKKNYILKRFETFKERLKADDNKKKYLKFKTKKFQKTEINIPENGNFLSKNITKLSFNSKIDNKTENENEKNKEENEIFNNNIGVHLENRYLSYLNAEKNLDINNLNSNNLNFNNADKCDYNNISYSVCSKLSDSTILACLDRQDSQNTTKYMAPSKKNSTKNTKNSKNKNHKSIFKHTKNFDDNNQNSKMDTSNLNIVILNSTNGKGTNCYGSEKTSNKNMTKSKSLTKEKLSLPNIFEQNKKNEEIRKSKLRKIPVPKSKYKKKSIVSLIVSGLPVINPNTEITYKSIDLRNTKSYNDIFKSSKENKLFYEGCKGLLTMENNNKCICPTLNLLVYDEVLEKMNFQRRAKSAMIKKEKNVNEKNIFKIIKKRTLGRKSFSTKKYKMNNIKLKI